MAYRGFVPASQLERQYRQKYGLSLSQVFELMHAADDKCECCGTKLTSPGWGADRTEVAHVDHCHATGRVRGILCHRCNTAIGLLNDRPELAVAYLSRS